jgi:hypothetical protein
MKEKLFCWIEREIEVILTLEYPSTSSAETIMIICEYLNGILLTAAKNNSHSLSTEWQEAFKRVIPEEHYNRFIEEMQNFALSPFSLETFDLITEYLD